MLIRAIFIFYSTGFICCNTYASTTNDSEYDEYVQYINIVKRLEEIEQEAKKVNERCVILEKKIAARDEEEKQLLLALSELQRKAKEAEELNLRSFYHRTINAIRDGAVLDSTFFEEENVKLIKQGNAELKRQNAALKQTKTQLMQKHAEQTAKLKKLSEDLAEALVASQKRAPRNA